MNNHCGYEVEYCPVIMSFCAKCLDKDKCKCPNKKRGEMND